MTSSPRSLRRCWRRWTPSCPQGWTPSRSSSIPAWAWRRMARPTGNSSPTSIASWGRGTPFSSGPHASVSSANFASDAGSTPGRTAGTRPPPRSPRSLHTRGCGECACTKFLPRWMLFRWQRRSGWRRMAERGGPMGNYDEIRLIGIGGYGYHGVLASEREEGQPFHADLVLHLDTGQAAGTDELGHTADYSAVARAVVEVIEGEPVNLIETLAARIADVALSFGAAKVEVTVHKPQAPLGVPFTDVQVHVSRTAPTGASATPAGPGVDSLAAPAPAEESEPAPAEPEPAPADPGEPAVMPVPPVLPPSPPIPAPTPMAAPVPPPAAVAVPDLLAD